MRFLLNFFITVLVLGNLVGCGYAFQGTKNELLTKEHVSTIYVKPLTNSTYQPGVENVVYNALVRILLAHGQVRVVNKPEQADAILSGSVGTAQYSVLAPTPVGTYGQPINYGFGGPTTSLAELPIASGYTASLGCSFALTRVKVLPGMITASLWSGSFSKDKPFPGSNHIDVPGTTSALINASEFDRAVGELAVSMMEDVHESMLARF
ncbi:LPS assembly lipoprotein LptE [Bdellovibrionota bacterium FG-1]